MNKAVILLLILLVASKLKSQNNESILRTKMSNQSSANAIANTTDGSLIYQPGNLSLFSYNLDRWMQIRQELQLCSDQLSILNGNSVEINGLLPDRKGETLSWSGSKWKSDDLAFIYEGRPLNFSLTEASTINHTVLNNIDRSPYMIFDGMYIYASTSPLSGSGSFVHGGLSVINTNNFNNLQFINGIEAQVYATVYYNSNLYPHNTWFTSLQSLCRIGNYLYFSGGSGPSIVDISSPNNPSFVASKEISILGSYILTDNQFVYYISPNDKLSIYRPLGDDLILIGSADFNYQGIRDAAIFNGHLYIINSLGLTVYNISNTSNPTLVSHLADADVPSFNNVTCIAIKNNRAYVGSFSVCDLSVIDISNPANLTVNHTVAAAPFTYNTSSYDFEIIDNILYAISIDDHVVFYDISDPNQTTRIDYVDLDAENLIDSEDQSYKLIVLNEEKLCVSFVDKKIKCFNVHFDRNYTGLGIATHPSNPTLNLENPLEVNGNASKIGSANWSTFSDVRVKKEVKPYKQGLNIIRKINPYQFNYRSNSGYTDTTSVYTGVMAQEMQYIMPESVKAKDDRKGSSGLEDKLQYDSSTLLWNLVNAIKELKNQEFEIEQLIQEEKSFKK